MASASTSFVGTESPLSEGGVWSATTTYWQTMRKASGAAVGTLAIDCAARYTGVSFAADHAAQVTLATVPTGGQLFFHYVFARMNATASCYQLSTAFDVGANVIQLWRINDTGTYTQVGADITLPGAMAVNDVMRLEAAGTTLTVKYNGATLRTSVDSTLTTGQPGAGGWAQNAGSNVVLLKDWAAFDLVNASMPPRGRMPSYYYSI